MEGILQNNFNHETVIASIGRLERHTTTVDTIRYELTSLRVQGRAVPASSRQACTAPMLASLPVIHGQTNLVFVKKRMRASMLL